MINLRKINTKQTSAQKKLKTKKLERNLNATWRTKDGQVLHIEQMRTGHCINCLGMIYSRVAKLEYELKYKLAKMSEQEAKKLLTREYKFISYFEAELEYRNEQGTMTRR